MLQDTTMSSRIPPPIPPGTESATEMTVLCQVGACCTTTCEAQSETAACRAESLLGEKPFSSTGQDHRERLRIPLVRTVLHTNAHIVFPQVP